VFTTPADIYHFHDPELMPTGLILRLAGRRVVFDSHEHIARDLGEKVWLPPIGRRLARLLGRGIERVADRWMSAVVITTPGMRDAYPSADTVLLRNLPKLAEFSDPPEWDTRSSAVSYIGLVCDFRGSRQIARLAERTSARVIVAGPLADAERAKLQDERGWKRVDYRGTVGRDGVVEILGQSRVGLAILLPMRNFEDSIPTKVLEYLAAGIPVVASDFASWRDLVEGAECVDFVDPTDDDQIAHAVNAILDDPGRAQAMGRAGREMVLSRYVWEREVESLFGLYVRLLAPRSDPVAIQPAQAQNAQS
jgi:glycosyltransferase involved in cell wall biosynthesis